MFIPSERTVASIVDGNTMPNFPLMRDNLRAAQNIYIPNANAIKGKSVSHKTR